MVLKALEYIVGAVLLGLALVVSTDPDHLCSEVRIRHVYDSQWSGPLYDDAVEVCVNDDRR